MENKYNINLHSDIKAMETYKRRLFDRKVDDGAVEDPDQILETLIGSDEWMAGSFKLGMERALVAGIILGMRYANREKVSLGGENLADVIRNWRMIALLDQVSKEHGEEGVVNG